MNFTNKYIDETLEALFLLDNRQIEDIIMGLSCTSARGGRLFILGVGGSAATASHAVNDFRKICNIESYCPVDNSSFITAITNDMGWENSFVEYLKSSYLCKQDSLLILSVGGGNQEKNVSMNIVKAIDYALEKRANIYGIVGRDGGYTAKQASACLIIPTVAEDKVTPHVEGLTSVILHLIVSHPSLKVNNTKW